MKNKYKIVMGILLTGFAGILLSFKSCAADSGELKYVSYLNGDYGFEEEMITNLSTSKSQYSEKGEHIYYVAPNGKDTGSGSKSSPFKTIRRAVKKLEAGDTLVLRGGTYKEKISIELHGNASGYITICSYKNEKAVLDGGGSTNEKDLGILNLNQSSYLRIIGLDVAHIKGESVAGIILGSKSHHLVLGWNKIYDIKVSSVGEDICANGIIGIGENKNKAIHDIMVYKNNIKNLKTGWSEAVSFSGNVKNINIVNNKIENTGNIGIDLSGHYGYCADLRKDYPRNCSIINNKVSRCTSSYATSYGIYVDGGKNIRIERNKITKCSGGIEIGAEENPKRIAFETENIIVNNNYVKENIENGITVGGYEKDSGLVTNVKISNNKCIDNGTYGITLTISKAKNVVVLHNIFSNNRGNEYLVSVPFSKKYTKQVDFSGNQYFSRGGKKKCVFDYRGVDIVSFEGWKMKVNDECSIFDKYLE